MLHFSKVMLTLYLKKDYESNGIKNASSNSSVAGVNARIHLSREHVRDGCGDNFYQTILSTWYHTC